MPDDAFGIATAPAPAAGGAAATSDAFGLRASVGRKQATATDHFGLGGAFKAGGKLLHAAEGGLVKAGGAIADVAKDPMGHLGQAALAPQRAVSTLLSDVMSPQNKSGQVAGDTAKAFLTGESQGKVDRNLETGFADLLDRNPGVKAALGSNPYLGMLTATRPDTGKSWQAKAGNFVRDTAAETLTDPTLVSSKVDVVLQTARLANHLLQTRAGDTVGKVIRDIVNRGPDLLNPIVDKDLHDVAKPPTIARMHGAAIAHATAESKRMQRQYETVQKHAEEMNRTGVIPPPIRHLLHEDAWLNGTADVRQAIDDEARANLHTFDDEGKQVEHVLDLFPELHDAPQLNIQTAFKKAYEPHTSVEESLKDFSDETGKRVRSETAGFNKQQKDIGQTTPLADRVWARLELGRKARSSIGETAAVLHELGMDGHGLSTVLHDHQMTDLLAGPRIVPNAWRYQSTLGAPEVSPRGGTFFHRDRNVVETYNTQGQGQGEELGGQHLIEADLSGATNPLLTRGGIKGAINVLRPNKLGSRLLGDREFAAPETEPNSLTQAPNTHDYAAPPAPVRTDYAPGMAGNAEFLQDRKTHEFNLHMLSQVNEPKTPFPNFDEIPGIIGHEYPAPTTGNATTAPTNTGHLFQKPFEKAANFGEMGIESPYASAAPPPRGDYPRTASGVPKDPDHLYDNNGDSLDETHFEESHDDAMKQWQAELKGSKPLPRGMGDTMAERVDTGESDLERQNMRRYFRATGMSDEETDKLMAFGQSKNDYNYTMRDKMASQLAKAAGHDVIHKDSGESFVLDPSIIKTGVPQERIDKLQQTIDEQKGRITSYQDDHDALWTPRGLADMVNAYVPIGHTATDMAKLVSEKASGFGYAPLSDEQKFATATAMHRDATRVTVPAAIAAKLTTPKVYKQGSNFLKNVSDVGRNALFLIPYTHMKNIGVLQGEGPGGAAAVGRGAEIFHDLERTPETYAKIIEHLESAGAAPHYFEPPIKKIDPSASNVDRLKNAAARAGRRVYDWSNKQLWNWDLAQRIALHEHLLEHEPTYERVSPYEQGAAINAVLFDYHHKSPMAETLRDLGAPFPHWTIGNVTLQLKQLRKDPRAIAAIAKTQDVINQSLFPPGTGFNLSFNDPAGEGLKTSGDLIGGFGARTLANKGGPLVGTAASLLEQRMNLQKFLLPENLKDLGGGMVQGFAPGGSILPELAGENRFKSKAPNLARAAAGLVGSSFPNEPSPRATQQRDLMDANWDMPAGWYSYHH